MSFVGAPSEWVDLIDSLVPDILELVSNSWGQMPHLACDAREDPTTETLCKLLRRNRDTGKLPFQIQIQMVELDPNEGEDQGRMDIAFVPLVPSESIYFCLECKRLNVCYGDSIRPYFSEYVKQGMLRFVRGQYAKIVRHGGMLGYVLDGKIENAISGVQLSLKAHQTDLEMKRPCEFRRSSIRPADPTTKETHHSRKHDTSIFQIHHMFVSGNAT
jgi:hypothetical protein